MEGVETVGPVTALEVLAEFPREGIKPLQDFRQWSSRVKVGDGEGVWHARREQDQGEAEEAEPAPGLPQQGRGARLSQPCRGHQ